MTDLIRDVTNTFMKFRTNPEVGALLAQFDNSRNTEMTTEHRHNQPYEDGLYRGQAFAALADEPEDAFQAEENARQYDDFVHVAIRLNNSEDPEGAWESFECGIADGINIYFR